MVLYKQNKQQNCLFGMMATSSWFCLVLLLWQWPSTTMACSSRSVPKPRPSSIRSNVIPTTVGTFSGSNSNSRMLKNGGVGGGSALLSSNKLSTIGSTSAINTGVNMKTTFKTASPRSANNKKIVSFQQHHHHQQQQQQQQQFQDSSDGGVSGTMINYKITLTTTTSTILSSTTTRISATSSTTKDILGSESVGENLMSITTSTIRPNITFPTFKCPANYDAWYCLNEATCFTVKIGDSIMYNCECAIGFMGPRCEYKELDGSYQPKRPKPKVETASMANGATCFLLFFLFFCLLVYVRCDPGKAAYLITPRPQQQQLQQQSQGLSLGILGEGMQGKTNRIIKDRGGVVVDGVCESDGRRGHRKYLNNGQQRKDDEENDFTRDCPYCCTQLQQKQSRCIL